jgi:uncharacterized membrane protein
MTVTSASVDRSANGRWLAVALLASLAFNLVLIGATGGFLWRSHFDAAETKLGHVVPNLLTYTSTLSEERRKQLWERTAAERRTMQPLRAGLRAAREAALKVLTAETYDRQAYVQAKVQLLAADVKAREAIYTLYGEIAANLTIEERQGFRDWRAKVRPRRNLLDEPQK